MLRGRTGLSPVMIGRHSALSRLLGLVEAAEVASSDGPEMALVSGEAGIGKTRLLREFIDAVPADVTVLTAQARPGSMGRPFDVVGQLCPPGDNPPAAARALLEAAIATGRTLLVVEDLHWADADSAHFLEQICMQPWPQLVIVGTYRGNDLSRKAPGGELVLRLERQHNVEQIRLDRLDRGEVAALLAAIGNASPSSGAVEAVYRRSGGIPFVIEELVRCCGPDACIDDLKTAQLPWSLDEAVRQQLGGLPPDERRVIDALAVFGDPAPFEILLDVCELTDDRLLPALR
ncbi:MAG: AAA family ATPase, partial [Actinomycetota bacterium]|nr:AAA family ATPase [Actinomycetota bacterium]